MPGKIEAEDYESANGIGTEETTDTGLGLNIKDLHQVIMQLMKLMFKKVQTI